MLDAAPRQFLKQGTNTPAVKPKDARERYSLKPKETRLAIDMGKGAADKAENGMVSRKNLRIIATYFNTTMGTMHQVLARVGLQIETEAPARTKDPVTVEKADGPKKKPRAKLKLGHKKILTPEEQLTADRKAVDEEASRQVMKATELSRREAAVARDEKLLRARETELEEDKRDIQGFVERMDQGYTTRELEVAVERALAEIKDRGFSQAEFDTAVAEAMKAHDAVVHDLQFQIMALETGTPRNLDAEPMKVMSEGVVKQMILVSNIGRDTRIRELEDALAEANGVEVEDEGLTLIELPATTRRDFREEPEFMSRADRRRADPAWARDESKTSSPNAMDIM